MQKGEVHILTTICKYLSSSDNPRWPRVMTARHRSGPRGGAGPAQPGDKPAPVPLPPVRSVSVAAVLLSGPYIYCQVCNCLSVPVVRSLYCLDQLSGVGLHHLVLLFLSTIWAGSGQSGTILGLRIFNLLHALIYISCFLVPFCTARLYCPRV